jgi:hypothetical protein
LWVLPDAAGRSKRNEEIEMKLGRAWGQGGVALLAWVALIPACGRRQAAETYDIVPKLSLNRASAHTDTPLEITYTWEVGPTAKRITGEYRALVQFWDTKSKDVLLFGDDHVPQPAPSQWEPGKSYSYTRTFFIPNYPYSGDVEVRMGLYPAGGRGERPALKGEDAGLREYRVEKLKLLPNLDNPLWLARKDGWHTPETTPNNPALEKQWTKREAVAQFKNPRKDVIVYLEADTNSKAFPQPPVLTLAVNGKAGATIPIQSSDVFLKKIRVKAADLGDGDWVELRLAMNQSFVPKLLGMNQDERELGLLVYHLFVGQADKLGAIPAESVVDAVPVSLPSAPKAAAIAGPVAKASAVGKPPSALKP